MRLCVIVMLALLQSAGFGSAVLAEKFKLDGEILFYDTDSAPLGQDEINWQDGETLVFLLRQQQQIEVLYLNSAGGFIEAAREMAHIIIDFELDARVQMNVQALVSPSFWLEKVGNWIGAAGWDSTGVLGTRLRCRSITRMPWPILVGTACMNLPLGPMKRHKKMF